MSEINIDELFTTINDKNQKRLENFDSILIKIHNRIKFNSQLEKTYCSYKIPEFIIGLPLYNINQLKKYLITSLQKNGFGIMYIEPNYIFISWGDIDFKKLKKKPKKELKQKSIFKSIDEYNPNGEFIYNDNSLRIIQDKSKQFLN
jgi:hypothetical protein